MKIWLVEGNINGRLCFDAEDEMTNCSTLYNFHKKNRINDWKKIRVTFVSTKKRKDILPINNVTMFWSMSHLFVCDEYAKQKISEKFNRIQFLEVEPIEKDIAKKSNYYLANVLDIIPGLYEDKCLFDYLDETILLDVKKYSFKEIVKDYPIFYLKINEKPFSPVFATDEYKNYIEECGITGFTFKEVFDFEK